VSPRAFAAWMKSARQAACSSEFTLRQSGTQMDQPHADETLEMTLGMEGFFIIHPKKERHRIDRDFAIFLPNLLNVDQSGVEEKIRALLPGYMAMGETGMGDMMDMGAPRNTLPMMTGEGEFGAVEMGGMFTVMKVREGITSYRDPGPYKNPPGTVAHKVAEEGGEAVPGIEQHHHPGGKP
jgi:manganese oxidase